MSARESSTQGLLIASFACSLLALACDRGATQNPDDATAGGADKTVTSDGSAKLASPWIYPAARVSPQVDDLHGVGVADP
ncbi:MAG TPA: hypothetical protein VK034_02370, partial [Enhygromyxa sp.]|nr:hypothetical protein [Enhygromyxa sp.]